ncbi:hypothetical protein HIM_10850 [Hirsutella minnesotensis 3608]|uniref:Cytochrome P450 n=1 Tax=Hirsutella minnesotensis 3608 TaxID=1043627 RepID=A0A0F7ZWY2_9HYPO|nr:hypothetical protein HIM_10850 [Hirsutella minnesotensis 3608]
MLGIPLTYVALALAAVMLVQRLFGALYAGRSWIEAAPWTNIQIVGVPSGLMPWSRALVQSLTCMATNTRKGYQEWCKDKNRPFAVPTMWTGKPMVILPPSQLHLVNRPENELTGFWALIENIQLPYFIGDRDVIENVIHFEVSRKDMNKRNVERLAESTADEVDAGFRELWGADTEQWKTVNGWDMCGSIIARVALRTIVGDSMCRDETLLETTRLFANSLFAAAAVINCTPPALRPFVGPVLALKAKFYGGRCRKLVKPLIEQRIRLWEKSQAGDSKGPELPNDFLQWLISRCASHGLEQLDTDKIAMRLLAINTMFVFAMSYVFSHAVIDMCVSPDRSEIMQGIREEVQRAIAATPGGLASREAVDQLYRADSVLRESMRLSDVSVVSLPRDVMGETPLDLGDGILIPPGTRLVYPTQLMHLDPDYHEDPLRFDAFRFSRQHEGAQTKGEDTRRLMVTLEPGFLAFGYGKRACPGRWFVAQTLKQALGYLAVNYDVELVDNPPQRKALLNMMIPPVDAKLRLRRRIE